MKICIINNIYPPYDRGGAEQVVVKTVEGLRDAGHEVVVITSSPRGDEQEIIHGIKIFRTRPRNIFFYTNAHHHSLFARFMWHIIDIWNFSTANWVKHILMHERPDIVHTHNLMGLSFLIPSVIRKLGIRHIHTVHDVQLVEPSAMILKEKEHSLRYRGVHTKVYSAILRTLMGSPQVVISPSHFLKTFYSARGFFKTSKFEIVRNPVTFEVASAHEVSRAAEVASADKSTNKTDVTREGHCENNGHFNFLYLGQIEYHKGILLLLEAFIQLKKELRISARLHIVGDGSLYTRVQELAREHEGIKVYGRKDRQELPELFAHMDMTVVPSLCYENSPTVIFESFAFGVPVLASDSEGIEELIQEGENGVMFEAAQAHSLKEKMKWCVEHRNEIQTMSTKTNLSVKGLSREAYIKLLEELYSF